MGEREVYPIVLYPEDLVRAESARPFVLRRELPAKPFEPTPPARSVMPPRRVLWPVFIGLIGLTVLFQGISMCPLILAICVAFMISSRGRELRVEAQYQEEKDEYDAAISDYETERSKADDEYEVELSRAHSEPSLIEYRERLRSEWWEDLPNPRPLDSDSLPRKGASEEIFFAHLKKRFGDKVSRDVTVYTEDEMPERPYAPDFVYFDPDARVAIDIEIDEPYAFFGSRSSIHLAVPNKRGTQYHREDAPRDWFFTSSGWTVVRLAEIQAVQEPQACCDVIEFVAATLAAGRPRMLSPGRPTSVPTWTQDDSLRLAAQRFRQQYLPAQLLPDPDAPHDPFADPQMSQLISATDIGDRYWLIDEEGTYADVEVLTTPTDFAHPRLLSTPGYIRSWTFRIAAFDPAGQKALIRALEEFDGEHVDSATLHAVSLRVVVHEYGPPAKDFSSGKEVGPFRLPKRGDRLNFWFVDDYPPESGKMLPYGYGYWISVREHVWSQPCDVVHPIPL